MDRNKRKKEIPDGKKWKGPEKDNEGDDWLNFKQQKISEQGRIEARKNGRNER